jgi:hypothetical protein
MFEPDARYVTARTRIGQVCAENPETAPLIGKGLAGLVKILNRRAQPRTTGQRRPRQTESETTKVADAADLEPSGSFDDRSFERLAMGIDSDDCSGIPMSPYADAFEFSCDGQEHWPQ